MNPEGHNLPPASVDAAADFDPQNLQVFAHCIAVVVPFTFHLKSPERLKEFDARVLGSDPAITPDALPAGLVETSHNEPHAVQTPQSVAARRWRRYAGARNNATGSDAPINPAYFSLYPQAQQVVHHPLDAPEPRTGRRHSGRNDPQLCYPYSLPLDGLYWPAVHQGATSNNTPSQPENTAVRLHSARLLLFRTGVGLLVLLLDVGAGAVTAAHLLDTLRALAEPHNCATGQPYPRIAAQIDTLAEHLLQNTLGASTHAHLRRKTWVSAAHLPSANRAQLQRLALLLGHRQNAAYALLPEYMQDAVYAPFAYVAHAVSVGGAASVVSDDRGAQPFVDIFVARVWSHTYLPLLLLPLHQHYFYLRHAEWEPLAPNAHDAVRKLEERFEENLDFQAHFASALVGQIDLHNAYVRTTAQSLRLQERKGEYERATHEYAGMLRVRRQRRLRFLEVAGSFAAVFIIVREVLEAAMQNGFIGDVPESRAWFALLQRWSPQQITDMIERVHHWDQAIFVLSLGAATVAALVALVFDRRIGRE